MTGFFIRETTPADGVLVKDFISARWGDEMVVVHAEIFYPAGYPGFIAELDGAIAGLLTYRQTENGCEVLTLDSLFPDQGIGSALLKCLENTMRDRGCRRIYLTTTNDNLHALGFYQRRGFRLIDIRPGAVDASRKIKPSIPLIGENQIALRDEIELELLL